MFVFVAQGWFKGKIHFQFLYTGHHTKLTIENRNKGNRHHEESHQQISHSKWHEKKVGSILQLSFKWYSKNDQNVSSDSWDDYDKNKQGGPFQLKPVCFSRGRDVGLERSCDCLKHDAARVTASLSTGWGSDPLGVGHKVSIVIWSQKQGHRVCLGQYAGCCIPCTVYKSKGTNTRST